MFFPAASLLALAATALAQTANFDAISKPTKDEAVPAGKSFAITWEPSAEYTGTVSISLLGGASPSTLQILSTIKSGVVNSAGTYDWSVASDLGDLATYGIKISLDSDPSVFQYSFPFQISASKSESSTTSTSTSSSTGSSGSTASSTASSTSATSTSSISSFAPSVNSTSCASSTFTTAVSKSSAVSALSNSTQTTIAVQTTATQVTSTVSRTSSSTSSTATPSLVTVTTSAASAGSAVSIISLIGGIVMSLYLL